MNQNAPSQATQSMTSEDGLSEHAMAMYPMAKICTGVMKQRFSGLILMLPGFLLIIFGALIIVEPKLLVWFIAAAAIFLGIMFLIVASFIRKMAT